MTAEIIIMSKEHFMPGICTKAGIGLCKLSVPCLKPLLCNGYKLQIESSVRCSVFLWAFLMCNEPGVESWRNVGRGRNLLTVLQIYFKHRYLIMLLKTATFRQIQSLPPETGPPFCGYLFRALSSWWPISNRFCFVVFWRRNRPDPTHESTFAIESLRGHNFTRMLQTMKIKKLHSISLV